MDGDNVQVTEPCDAETPNLLTDGTTTPATTSDFAVLPTLQVPLAPRQLTPGAQLVDAGSVTSDHLLTSRTEHRIDLMGPVAVDQRWQGQAANGFAAAQCVIDWAATDAICPPGQQRVVWLERPERHGQATVRSAFSQPGCAACARRAACPHAATAPRAGRSRERDHYTVLQAARARPQTDTFQKVSARRAGIEGTMAQGTRMDGRRRSRYIGLVTTRLMHRLVAAALNFMRVAAWLAAIPRAQPRSSAFAALAAAAYPQYARRRVCQRHLVKRQTLPSAFHSSTCA